MHAPAPAPARGQKRRREDEPRRADKKAKKAKDKDGDVPMEEAKTGGPESAELALAAAKANLKFANELADVPPLPPDDEEGL
ncbi:hypothetical protein N7510_007652 [Penicillium lagena]|uniref:uncharacterized protein n=1 Tax=Penicillium lagena TaxID=94218 RepID=UPI0025424E25|nr:uncharacterized protein N7510_007652 [Penicillium lagena]KAJ5610933.1 hypothetical protein N7510_007652 [Penicillium lagena]